MIDCPQPAPGGTPLSMPIARIQARLPQASTIVPNISVRAQLESIRTVRHLNCFPFSSRRLPLHTAHRLNPSPCSEGMLGRLCTSREIHAPSHPHSITHDQHAWRMKELPNCVFWHEELHGMDNPLKHLAVLSARTHLLVCAA